MVIEWHADWQVTLVMSVSSSVNQSAMSTVYGHCAVASRTVSSLTIAWIKSSQHVVLGGYHVRCNCSRPGSLTTLDVSTHDTFVTVDKLRPATTYAFSVSEYNANGAETGFSTCYETTLAGMPPINYYTNITSKILSRY